MSMKIFIMIMTFFNTLGLYYIVHEINLIREKIKEENK